MAVISTDLAQQWATRINRTLAETVQAIIATGCAFHDAKKALHHGGWQRLFDGHSEAVADPVRCSVRTAQRLMVIAHHPVLAKATHASLLPTSWDTLYELTKVPDSELQRALEDGRIHAGLERREARMLRSRDVHIPAHTWTARAAIQRVLVVFDREMDQAHTPADEAQIIAALWQRMHPFRQYFPGGER